MSCGEKDFCLGTVFEGRCWAPDTVRGAGYIN